MALALRGLGSVGEEGEIGDSMGPPYRDQPGKSKGPHERVMPPSKTSGAA